MKLKKIASSIAISVMVVIGSFGISHADGSNVVTLGVNLSQNQKQKMLDYFGVKKDQVLTLNVSNSEERKYLRGVASEAQLGRATISCAYVEPTTSGGINVKTANLTWVTSSMIASTLSTAGLKNANVIAAAPYQVSGTGALTGIMKAFEDASGQKLDESKKELASQELVTTGDLGDNIGREKASGIMNDIKSEVIKNGTSDTNQIAKTINNISNNYNINLTPEQQQKIKDLMLKISKQNYDYNDMKNTLNNVQNNVSDELKNLGVDVKNSGFFDKISSWFSGLFSGKDKNLGILNHTNDNALGSNAVIDSTDKNILNNSKSEQENSNDSLNNGNNSNNEDENQGQNDESFVDKLSNFIKSLF